MEERAHPRKKEVQVMRRFDHLQAQPHKSQQVMRRVEHLRAQPRKKQVQAMLGGGSRICEHTRERSTWFANFHGSSIVEFVWIVTKVIRIFICIRAQIGYQGRMRNPGNQTKTGQLINVVRIN